VTKDEALALADSGFWEHLSHEERARFQIAEERLCMPFGVFHEAVEKTLGRSVFTHEFGLNHDGLKAEILDGAEPPTMDEIIGLLPPDKTIVLRNPHAEGGDE
jgi:hypothetical protein